MVALISNIISNRTFFLSTRGVERSRLKRLRTGVPQGSVLAPTLFNISVSDVSPTAATKYACADDLALSVSLRSTSDIEASLTDDMHKIASYLHQWRLRLNQAKTTVSLFHLHKAMAHKKLNVSLNGNMLPFTNNPVYIGATIDRSLTYKEHPVWQVQHGEPPLRLSEHHLQRLHSHLQNTVAKPGDVAATPTN